MTKLGLGGANCDELCPQGQMIVGIYAFAIPIGLFVAFYSFYITWKLSRFKSERKLSPPMITLIFSGLGTFCYAVACMIGLANTVGFPTFYQIQLSATGRQLKRSPLMTEQSVNIFLGLSAALGTAAITVLPLAWIDIAQRALKLRNKATIAINVLTFVLVILILLVVFPFYIVAGAYRDFPLIAFYWSNIILYSWYAILSVICLINLLALVKMNQLSMVHNESKRNTTQGKEEDKFDKVIFRIKMTAIINAVISMVIVGLLVGSANRVLRGFYTDPRCDVDLLDLQFRLLVLIAICWYGIGLWFIVPSTVKRIQDLHSSAVASRPATESPNKHKSRKVNESEAAKQEIVPAMGNPE
jgi:hypothetical protein